MSSRVDRVVGLVRAQVVQAQTRPRTMESLSPREFQPLELPERANLLPGVRDQWLLSELLASYDREFVQNAYLALLKRDTDVQGLNTRLQALQNGELTRLELLFRLRYGPEGRMQGVRVKGLLKAFLVERVCRVPLLGIPLRYLVALARLPRMQRELEQLHGLLVMYKNDSDSRDRSLADFQNAELERIIRHLEDNRQ